MPIGKACGGEEMLILGDDLTPLPPGETVGEIYIARRWRHSGYWRDEQDEDGVPPAVRPS